MDCPVAQPSLFIAQKQPLARHHSSRVVGEPGKPHHPDAESGRSIPPGSCPTADTISHTLPRVPVCSHRVPIAVIITAEGGKERRGLPKQPTAVHGAARTLPQVLSGLCALRGTTNPSATGLIQRPVVQVAGRDVSKA